ncbi:hypothetical protein [Muriicola sp. Z0-33]|uniref:hypothetical protein n=1 Tax=Muriicola sp. Z0-33 TaxID=2816957 RepID=UPI0022370683|nr:hypothetical protein [Muriicola sp. Z0-33]MCW5517696.1 hypothetical protein [Muriicola sp. Z0-33]
MKKYLFLIVLTTLLSVGCKTDKKVEPEPVEKELTVLEKIATANGIENWDNIEELKFTFNVDRDTMHFERSWIWNRKSNEITGISMGQTSTYNRSEVDSTTAQVDGAFINDKYWLLAPINIMWDKDNLTETYTPKTVAPISGDSLQKLTVVYNNIGGYTPGDAYDFYFGEDHMVKEWVFRKGNQEAPNSVTTWEDYADKGGLKIALMHQSEDKSFKIYFTDVSVTLRE